MDHFLVIILFSRENVGNSVMLYQSSDERCILYENLAVTDFSWQMFLPPLRTGFLNRDPQHPLGGTEGPQAEAVTK